MPAGGARCPTWSVVAGHCARPIVRTIIVKTLNRQFINGRVQESHGHDMQAVTSAVTGKRIAQGVLGDDTDANLAVEAARQALPAWSATTLDQRREYLQKLANSFVS